MNSILNTLHALTRPINLSQSPGLVIQLGDWCAHIQSNSGALIAELQDYFQPVLANHQAWCLQINAIQTDDLAELHALPFDDWQREPGKTGRKEAVLDFEDEQGHPQRLVHKIKTGMVLWQNAQTPCAFGNLEAHPNQVINFVLSQYLNHNINQAWLLGHCAGLDLKGRGIAIAGVSGGGKSTLMLRLLEQAQSFISNDRVLFKRVNGENKMRGIPKQPRINPGTIIHNPKLHALIDDHASYLAMASEDLRALEQKYDAPVHQLFNGVNYQSECELHELYLLNWQVDSHQPTRIEQVDLSQRDDLLLGVMKSPGPFYQDANQQFQVNGQQLDPLGYIEFLSGLQCFEIKGRLDFDAMVQLILKKTSNNYNPY